MAASSRGRGPSLGHGNDVVDLDGRADASGALLNRFALGAGSTHHSGAAPLPVRGDDAVPAPPRAGAHVSPLSRAKALNPAHIGERSPAVLRDGFPGVPPPHVTHPRVPRRRALTPGRSPARDGRAAAAPCARGRALRGHREGASPRALCRSPRGDPGLGRCFHRLRLLRRHLRHLRRNSGCRRSISGSHVT
jgi:hypothetical protein